MTKVIEVDEIMRLIPHRYPFLLIDRVLDYHPFDFLTAIKNVSVNEPFFQGHFPGKPIMPGVLMIEALAQACAVLSNVSREPNPDCEYLHFFAGIDNAKFKHVVTPGDQIRIEVKFVAQKRDFWRMHGEVFVGEKCVCLADLMSASKEIKRDKSAS